MFVVWLAGALVGCGEVPAPKREPVPQVASPAPPPPPQGVPDWQILAPSPLDLEDEVRKSGVADTLADLVPAELPPTPPLDERDRVAFRTGVVFAYTLLSGRSAKKPELLRNVRSLREGMAAIGTGAGLLSTMDRAIEQLQNDTASREDFLKELDDQVSSSVPEEGWAPNDTTGPLLQGRESPALTAASTSRSRMARQMQTYMPLRPLPMQMRLTRNQHRGRTPLGQAVLKP